MKRSKRLYSRIDRIRQEQQEQRHSTKTQQRYKRPFHLPTHTFIKMSSSRDDEESGAEKIAEEKKQPDDNDDEDDDEAFEQDKKESETKGLTYTTGAGNTTVDSSPKKKAIGRTPKKQILAQLFGKEEQNQQQQQQPTANELQELLALTNFTEREIKGFYKYSQGTTDPTTDQQACVLNKTEFARLLLDQGLTNAALVDRLWVVLDRDHDQNITHKELIIGREPNEDNDAASSSCLTTAQKQRLTAWIHDHAGEDEQLDQQEFIQAVLDLEDTAPKPPFCTCRSTYYIFWTAWFEMGTSFALPAMGALSGRIKDRFETTDAGIGALTSAYYVAAMVGPLVGGLFMDKYGPGTVVIAANVIVAGGAFCQALANGPDQFWLLILGRLLLGFGGEITPFTTVEILGRLFPDYFGLMAGVRNLIQSTSGFLAFVLLPIWADTQSNENDGTSFALWMCFLLAGVSLVSCVVVKFSMNREAEHAAQEAAAEAQSDQATITKTIRAFAKATTPVAPLGCEKWKLPFSFYLAAIGIKGQYFAPFAFTAFSNEIYKDKFGQTATQASFQTGVISLVAGILGPPMGALSDKYGQRAPSLMIASLFSVVGFVALAIATGGDVVVWVATLLFAIQYGFGDTVAYISIRFIVGVDRAGIGYGIYGILGNLIASVVPVVGGILLDQDSGGEELVCWYFAGLMLFAALCWLLVRVLEGKRSLLELPADKIIETSDEDIQLAALSYVVAPPHESVPKTEENGGK